MSDIKKYTNPVLSEDSGIPEYVHGGWVKYTDHAKAIEAKDKEIERLKSTINNACQHLDAYWSGGYWPGVVQVLVRLEEVLND